MILLPKKLLILGASGLTGYKISMLARNNMDVYGTYNIRPTSIEGCTSLKLDITNKIEVENIFSQIKPDYVINTTALHNVDYCEEHNDEAIKVNTEAVRHYMKTPKNMVLN